MERNYNAIFSNVVNYISVIPYLYRYENDEFIGRFFDKGEIFISSFQQYKKYSDNQLGDKSEGSNHLVGQTENNKTVIMGSVIGFNDYSFCTSTVLDTELLEHFQEIQFFG